MVGETPGGRKLVPRVRMVFPMRGAGTVLTRVFASQRHEMGTQNE